VQMVLLLVALRRRMGTICANVLARSAVRTLGASLLASAAGWGAARSTLHAAKALDEVAPVARLVPGVAGLVIFSITFLLASRMLGSHELEEISSALGRTLTRRSKLT